MNPDDLTLTEAQVKARAEYLALSPEERAEVDQRWTETPEHIKEDLRIEAELDLL